MIFFCKKAYICGGHAHLLEVVEEVAVGADLLRGAAVEALPVLLAVLGVRVVERELNAVVRGTLRQRGNIRILSLNIRTG